ncbi:hypothetical protein CSHISOI_06552 [Colletotrichum shisoi]|uniref:Glycoside-hydrolase family GH114 TIM-barrel domain-containing protein n=1 Tax=Colletotrichum shisoi TaxID=2078593 RepID=A0A5Q4BQ74_9PEZI|nr:hypothetical protein CSHISOI_06552 [Colletotrichum shisoi]
MTLSRVALLSLAPAGILGLATSGGLSRRAVDWGRWKPGVSFRIVLHQPNKANTVADVTPAEAVVWDIDLQHVVDYDNIIPNLKVFPSSSMVTDPGISRPGRLSSATSTAAHKLTTASSRPLLLGQKNAPTIAPQLSSVADFAVLETCLGTRTSDEVEPFCADFQPYVEAGKPVFQIEYPTSVRDDMDIDQAEYDNFCVNKNGNEGFSEVLKHASEQVDGRGQFCGLGRTGGRFETPIEDEE